MSKAATKKTARPAARPAKSEKPPAAADWVKTFTKGAGQLIASIEERGLLEHDEIVRLRKAVDETVSESAGAALTRAGRFHGRLAACLAGDGNITDAVKARKLDALYEINRIVAGTNEPAQCFERLLVQIRKMIPCEGATLYLVDRRQGRLNVAASIGPMIDLIDRIEFDQGLGFSGWVAKTQKPVIFGSLKRSQPTHSGVIKSFLSAPLVVGGETIGVINLGHPDEEIFKKDDLRLLILIASQAGGMIQKTLMLDEMKDLAITDDLTGLYNRRHFMVRMSDEVARASRFMQEFSVVTIDLDEFKRYNDAFGPETGDRALADLGALLKSRARASDIVARTGGEEFALLLPATSRTEALLLAERLRMGVESHTFPRRKRLTISVGVATYPHEAIDPQELLTAADKALYQARREGHNRSVTLPAVAA